MPAFENIHARLRGRKWPVVVLIVVMVVGGALLLAQENGDLSDTQVVEIIAQWENFLSRRYVQKNKRPAG